MDGIKLEELLESSIKEREELLAQFPKLAAFQAEIDSRISENQDLNGRLLSLAKVHMNYRSLR